MSEQDFFEDQTIFAEEEPYHLSARKKKPIDDLSSVKKPPLPLFIGAAVFVVLLVVVGITIMLKNQKTPIQVVTATPTPTPPMQTSSQIDQMMTELKSAVESADPSRTSLPFPPVADQIRIAQ